MAISHVALILLLASVAPTAAGAGCLWQPGEVDNWRVFRDSFIGADGRVIDTGNGGVSHSEGQGFGMRLAVQNGDRDSFEQLWTWTREHLYVRGDHLAAWRWDPDASPQIDDKNNASDGDLLIAWALGLAAERWQEPSYREQARAVAADIRRLLLRESRFGTLLLPGTSGFERDDGVILNLSYWVFPALQELAVLEPHQPAWPALIASGRRLLEQARFGHWDLPPDWIAVKDGKLAFPKGFEARFGYDAIRIPLYLIWADITDEQYLQPFARFWSSFATPACIPDGIDLVRDVASSRPAPPGIHSVIALVGFTAEDGKGARALRLPGLEGERDWYGAALSLLVEGAATRWCQMSRPLSKPPQGMRAFTPP